MPQTSQFESLEEKQNKTKQEKGYSWYIHMKWLFVLAPQAKQLIEKLLRMYSISLKRDQYF